MTMKQTTPQTRADWPLVVENDYGIRPAGKPDECFYCQQKVGSPHGPECVMVTKRVEMRVKATMPSGIYLGLWQFNTPHYWSVFAIEFHKNGSSWCASNFTDEPQDRVTWDAGDPWPELKSLAHAYDGCLCGRLEFEFIRVVDDTPRVVREEG